MNPIRFYAPTDDNVPEKTQGYNGLGWYFWQEDWAFCNGPFATEAECTKALEQYADELETRHN